MYKIHIICIKVNDYGNDWFVKIMAGNADTVT